MEDRNRLMMMCHGDINKRIAAGMASLRAGRSEDGDAAFDAIEARLEDIVQARARSLSLDLETMFRRQPPPV